MEHLSNALPNDILTHAGLPSGLPDLPSGVLSSAIASLGTGLGAVPLLFTTQVSDRWKKLMLSIGGGVMLSAAAFSLLLPALELSRQVFAPEVVVGLVAIAVIAGASLFYGFEQLLPEPELDAHRHGRRIWLFVLAIALHHFPEGLAVGIGVEAAQDPGIAIGVALQNLPEGLMVALALRELGYGGWFALAIATISGWLEPLGGLLGVTLAGSSLAPIGMSLATGAMLFVLVHELLPELNLQRFNSSGSVGLVTGLLAMAIVEQMV